MTPTEIRSGHCVCWYEPRGLHGLEGYQRNDTYMFQHMKDKKGEYYRVYPEIGELGGSSTYYETCGRKIFNRYFKIVDLIA